jgi:epoxyqueuosine reductase
MDLDANIRELALSLDADYFGVADLSSAHNAILEQGGERVARYPRAVTIGMRLQDSLVDLLPDDDKAAAILYKHNSYDVVNLALDQISLRVANMVQRAGFDAFPIPASKHILPEARSTPRRAGMDRQKLSAGHFGSRPPGPVGYHSDQCSA